jgi:hypothetical protein
MREFADAILATTASIVHLLGSIEHVCTSYASVGAPRWLQSRLIWHHASIWFAAFGWDVPDLLCSSGLLEQM